MKMPTHMWRHFFNEIFEKLGYNYNIILIYFDYFLKIDFEKIRRGEIT